MNCALENAQVHRGLCRVARKVVCQYRGCFAVTALVLNESLSISLRHYMAVRCWSCVETLGFYHDDCQLGLIVRWSKYCAFMHSTTTFLLVLLPRHIY